MSSPSGVHYALRDRGGSVNNKETACAIRESLFLASRCPI